MVVPIHIRLLVGRLSLIHHALHGHCPQCKQASVFNGLLSVHDNCPECQLDLTKNETADGPTFIVITFLGFVITGLAVWVEFSYKPDYWIHAAIWIPVILISSPILLRLTKSFMITTHYEIMKHDD